MSIRELIPQGFRDQIRSLVMGATRLARGTFSYARVGGFSFKIDLRDPFISFNLLYFGTWEPNPTRLLKQIVRSGDRIVDVGAHIGYYTVILGAASMPGGRILAVEPDADNFLLLRDNVEANLTPGVAELVNAAVGPIAGWTSLVRGEEWNTGDYRIAAASCEEPFSTKEHDMPVVVPVTTVDDLTRAWDCVNLIKIDAQGCEPLIIRGMQATLASNPELIILTEFWPKGILAMGQSPSEYCRQLADLGFRLYNADDARLRSIGCDELRQFDDNMEWSINLLCVRPAAMRRLLSSGFPVQ